MWLFISLLFILFSTSDSYCVPPGICVPPKTNFSLVVNGPSPGQQWNIGGGFCGSWSTQQCALSVGAWISQDLVRKANRDQTDIEHHMHGDRTEGYEVMPSNVVYTAQKLKLVFESWDYTQPTPQATAYKAWLKKNLVQGYPIVWFPMCKGDGHECYTDSCPGGGHVDHVEPMFGIFSNHPLSDTTVYPDDWILHASDQDDEPYYRLLSSMEDTPKMDGNCLHAQPGFKKNEMYPCFDENVAYGLAVKGLAVTGSLPVSLTTDVYEEPNVRLMHKPSKVNGVVTVGGLKEGVNYTIYRYGSTDDLPSAPPFDKTAEHTYDFTATGETYTFKDPNTFQSNSATYYLAAAKE